MRGQFRDQGGLFSYILPEARVPPGHPLRQIRGLVRAVLQDLSHSLGKLYASEGRPSIPPEQLLSALLLQVFYGLGSERQLMEQLNYNLLFRWFVGLSPDDPVWDATTFTKNRDRLQRGDVLRKFMERLLDRPRVKPLLSDEHFSVDGTLIEAWASHKSFQPKDGSDDGDGSNFHGQRRKNDTHQSTSDPHAKLYRKAAGREAKLCYMGHAVMEKPNGLAVDDTVTPASGIAERRASEAMLKKKAKRSGRRITVGEDKAYDTQRSHCGAARDEHHTACCAERQPDQDRQASQQRNRWAHDPPHRLPHLTVVPRDERVHLRLGQAARHHAQDQAPRYCRRGCRFPAQSHRLQSRAHPQAHRRLRLEPVRKSQIAPKARRKIQQNNKNSFNLQCFSADC